MLSRRLLQGVFGGARRQALPGGLVRPLHRTLAAASQRSKLADWMANRADGADPRACEVLTYWFGGDWATCGKCRYDKAQFSKWFKGGAAVDEEIKAKFLDLHTSLASGELDHWLTHPTNALAGVVVMDQFARNIYRDTPQMYATDAKALAWSNHIVDTGLCASMPLCLRAFVMFPFEHSESLADQQKTVTICEGLITDAKAEVASGDPEAPEVEELLKMFLAYAHRHLVVVEKWGRFPHRNKILGRESTPEELAGFAAGTIASF